MARLSKAKVKAALVENNGNVSAAARSLGCNRSSVYEYINKYPEIEEILDDARQVIVDKAEEALASRIEEGDTTAIIFTLKTRGRDRGWGEKIETEHSGTIEHTFKIEPPRTLDDPDD